jgi:hypothetical protein
MSEIKTRDYINKSLDEMTAEELRHGALKWATNEAEGQGLIDKMRRKIAALEAQIKGGGQ